ncbi:MAG: CBS domain-containing protein [Nanoarchaeota archaeon]|nr:CBS domain-containing protein [Nanoarchaeota archaeon]
MSKIMKKNRVGSVVLMKGEIPAGIITEQDVVRKVVSEEKNPKKTLAGSLAEKELISIESLRDLSDAVTLMGCSEIKHLPVIDGGKLQGIITAKDVIKLEPHLMEMISFKSSIGERRSKKLFK